MMDSSGIQIYKRLHQFYLKYAPEAVHDPYSPSHWKEKVLYLFVLVSLPAGALLFAIGVPVSVLKGDWLVAAAAVFAYAACILVFVNPQLRYHLRAITACMVIYILGFSLLMDVGPFFGTREYLFAFSILSALLLGWNGAAASITLNLLTCLLISFLLHCGFWSHLLMLDNPLRDWHMIVVDLLFINITTTILITLFFKRIEQSETTAKNYSHMLLKERETLAESNRLLQSEMEERRAVAEALRTSEEKYRTILDTVQDAYFETDLKGQFTFFNQAMVERSGYTAPELSRMTYRDIMDDQNARALSAEFNRMYKEKMSGRLVDIDIRHREGRLISINVLAAPLYGPDGHPAGYQGLARDITEHKAMEIRLNRAKKMEAVGTLAGGVAHDLNNTLFGVVGYPELLLMNMSETHPMRRPLEEMKKSGEKAVAIVQDLLTLARRGVSVREVVNLNVALSEYLQSNEFHKLQSFHPGVRIHTDLDPGLLNMSGSPLHLSKTVMNLISNAAEAITGEGDVYISTENRYVEPNDPQAPPVDEGDYVALTIRDTGEGISPAASPARG